MKYQKDKVFERLFVIKKIFKLAISNKAEIVTANTNYLNFYLSICLYNIFFILDIALNVKDILTFFLMS